MPDDCSFMNVSDPFLFCVVLPMLVLFCIMSSTESSREPNIRLETKSFFLNGFELRFNIPEVYDVLAVNSIVSSLESCSYGLRSTIEANTAFG